MQVALGSCAAWEQRVKEDPERAGGRRQMSSKSFQARAGGASGFSEEIMHKHTREWGQKEGFSNEKTILSMRIGEVETVIKDHF